MRMQSKRRVLAHLRRCLGRRHVPAHGEAKVVRPVLQHGDRGGGTKYAARRGAAAVFTAFAAALGSGHLFGDACTGSGGLTSWAAGVPAAPDTLDRWWDRTRGSAASSSSGRRCMKQGSEAAATAAATLRPPHTACAPHRMLVACRSAGGSMRPGAPSSGRQPTGGGAGLPHSALPLHRTYIYTPASPRNCAPPAAFVRMNSRAPSSSCCVRRSCATTRSYSSLGTVGAGVWFAAAAGVPALLFSRKKTSSLDGPEKNPPEADVMPPDSLDHSAGLLTDAGVWGGAGGVICCAAFCAARCCA